MDRLEMIEDRLAKLEFADQVTSGRITHLGDDFCDLVDLLSSVPDADEWQVT